MKHDLLRFLQKTLRGELRKRRRRKNSAPLAIAVLVIAVFAINWWLDEPDAPLPGKGASLACSISKVADGDTVTASCDNGKLKVRVYGIDAPEMGQKPWGEQSRKQLQSMLPNGPVQLQVQDTDRYGRVVAQLFNGEQDLGLEMVRQGQAVVYAQYNDSPEYDVAQSEAQRDKRGVWSQSGAQQTPGEWRKLNPR